MNKKIDYVVTMYRWGDYEKHSYVLGVYSTLDAAEKAGNKEAVERGGKYEFEVVKCVDCKATEIVYKLVPNKYVKTEWQKYINSTKDKKN